MVKPDVIVSWPANCDYPLWRQFIRDERQRFGQVIVAFTRHDGLDMTDFVAAAMADEHPVLLDRRYVDAGDWRNDAVNAALAVSDAEWVWFTEQDFFITRPKAFWANVEDWEAGVDAIGIEEPGGRRLHPACLFVRRSAVNATARYFGTVPVDHFGAFTDELKTIYVLPAFLYEHLQGLSQNHWLIDSGQEAGRFKMDRFDQYLRDCLKVSVPLDSDWAERSRSHLRAQAA